MNFFSIDRINFLVLNPKGKLIRYDIDNKSFDEFDEGRGLVGVSLSKGTIIETIDPFNDPTHDPRIDIKTNLPLLTMPLKSASHEIFGVIQIIRVKIIMENKKNEDFYNFTLQHYETLISHCYEHVLKYNSN